MAVGFDLNLLPFARYAGQEYPHLLGLHVAEPPRSAARGRAADRLILYLVMTGNAPLSPARQTQLLEGLAKLYYSTSGTATSAMRAVAEQLNDLLLQRNLRLASSSRQGMAVLTQAVIRDNQVYLAHSGPNHAYLISSNGTQVFYDAELETERLGQGRVAAIAYHQAGFQVNDTLILAVQPSPVWDEENLSGLHGQGPESIRRRLFAPAEGDLNALLIQARPGKGKFFILRTKAAVPEGQPTQGASQPAPLSLEDDEGEAQPGADDVVSDEIFTPLPDEGQPAPGAEAGMPYPESQPAGESSAPPGAAPEVARRPAQRKFSLSPLWKVLVTIGTPLALILQRLGSALRTLLVRMLPVDPFQAIPNSMMLFIAFVIPVVIGTIAGTVYFELGRDAQFDVLLARAQQMAKQAAGQSDLLAQRADWESTLGLLDEVEARKSTPESQALRAQARAALDNLDLVRRLDFIPALSGLPASVNITRIVAADVELYLLDINSGSVFHARLTSQGFVLDPSFECGPNVSGILKTGPVIDIVAWPAGFTPVASLLAMDAGGNALYCQPNQTPQVEKMTAPPNALMENLRGFTLDGSDLYILDPFSNAVWVYSNSNLEAQPYLYFDQEVPYLSDVIDLVVNSGELYLLHEDGRVTFCTPGTPGVVPARCYDDVKYIDSRLGRENTPLLLSLPFTQALVSEPPDPSLYLLQAKSQAVYHFSLRNLVFQRQYLPAAPSLTIDRLSTLSATAFAVNPIRRYLFLAVGNQVFYALQP